MNPNNNQPNPLPAFVDAEEYYSHGSNLTIKDIILHHVRRIGTLASKEMCGGYWIEKPISVSGNIILTKNYVPDSREEYINAVSYLADILYPHFDKEMREAEKELNIKLESLIEKQKPEVQEDYKYNKYILFRELFRLLNSFLFRVQYLEGKSFEDEGE